MRKTRYDALDVYTDGQFAGCFAQDRCGKPGFTYDAEYEARPAAIPLSRAIPLYRSEHRPRAVAAFFQGLLPDRSGRLELLARRRGVSPNNPFALLQWYGLDAAGAVQVVPAGEGPGADEDAVEVDRLDEDALADLVADVVAHPSSWGSDAEGRWTLAGAQPKLALYRDDDGWGIPRGNTPTTHILKPAVAPYVGHDVNEFVTMRAARHLGLNVADAELMTTARGDRVFVSTRYDRVFEEGRWRRRHQEDCCQALSVTPALKYQSDGGPGLAAMAQLIDTFPDREQRRRSQRALFDAMAFNVSVANTDAHAKNYSILLDAERAELAPLYDLGTHLPYSARGPLTSAMKVGEEYRLDRIGVRDLVAVGRKLRISTDEAESRVHEIRGALRAGFSAAVERVPSADERVIAAKIASAVGEHVTGRGWFDSTNR